MTYDRQSTRPAKALTSVTRPRWLAVLGAVLVWVFAAATNVAHGGPPSDYLSVYALGSLPSDHDAWFQGRTRSGTTVGNGAGGGIKGGVFPNSAKGIVGFELEWYGHGGSIRFPQTSVPGEVSTHMIVFNTMANLIVRYPGEKILPYGGVGAGVSHSMLTDTTIPGSTNTDLGGSWTLGYQLLAGTQVVLTDRTFFFVEYKYFSANYHWEQMALDFRTQYLLGGIGWHF